MEFEQIYLQKSFLQKSNCRNLFAEIFLQKSFLQNCGFLLSIYQTNLTKTRIVGQRYFCQKNTYFKHRNFSKKGLQGGVRITHPTSIFCSKFRQKIGQILNIFRLWLNFYNSFFFSSNFDYQISIVWCFHNFYFNLKTVKISYS